MNWAFKLEIILSFLRDFFLILFKESEDSSQAPVILKKLKVAECSEADKYAKIFCDIFARVSVKNFDIFPDIFKKKLLSLPKNIV